MKKMLAIGITLLFWSCGNYYGEEKEYNNIQIYYTSTVSVEDVDKLGNYLVKRFDQKEDDNRKTFQLNKKGKLWEVKMVVKKGLEQDLGTRELLKTFAGVLSKNVFNGEKVDVHMCDNELNTLFVCVGN